MKRVVIAMAATLAFAAPAEANEIATPNDALGAVMAMYGQQVETVSLDGFMLRLNDAKASFNELSEKYERDQFFRLTERVAESMVFAETGKAAALEDDEKYLRSLVKVGADLELIFEAENEYRAALAEYREVSAGRAEFDLDAFGLYGVTENDVNAAVDLVNEIYDEIDTVTFRPDIGKLDDLQYPVRAVVRVTSKFGYRANPFGGQGREFHNGLDFGAAYGTPVQTEFAGKVLFAGDKGDGFGKCVLVAHSNELQTLYAHLSQIEVEAGDMVTQYEKIGEVGSTGRSTGPHLHFGVYVNEKPVDPIKLFGGELNE